MASINTVGETYNGAGQMVTQTLTTSDGYYVIVSNAYSGGGNQ